MRLLIVTNTYPPADITGVGALAVEMAGALGSSGHDVRVLTRAVPPGDRYATAIGGPKLLFPLLAAWRFLRLRHTFDVVHVHESDGAFVLILARILRRLGRKAGTARLVATLQVSYLRELRAVRPIRAGGVVVSLPTASERVFAWLRAPLHLLLGRWSAGLADAVVAPSEATARELRADYAAQVTAVVPNGLALDDAAGAAPAMADVGRPMILYAGRLRTRKAVAVLVEAFATVRRQVPAATLVLVGDGEMRPQLEAQVARLQLRGAVRFTGSVPRADIGRWYASADVFCLPSTYEGFPVAILEAMAHGLPVVATRVAGIPEAVEEGVTGYLVEPEDAAALAVALHRLLVDAELRGRMAAAARTRFAERFQVGHVVRAYLAVYQRLLRGDPHPRLDP